MKTKTRAKKTLKILPREEAETKLLDAATDFCRSMNYYVEDIGPATIGQFAGDVGTDLHTIAIRMHGQDKEKPVENRVVVVQ